MKAEPKKPSFAKSKITQEVAVHSLAPDENNAGISRKTLFKVSNDLDRSFTTPAQAITGDHQPDTNIPAKALFQMSDDTRRIVTSPAANDAQPRFELLNPMALRQLPTLKWLVQGLLPERGFACVYGASGAGKSFIALDLAASIAAGNDWCGFKVQRAPVVFCVLEGTFGFKNRAAAWEAKKGELAPGFLTSLQDLDLTDPKQVQEFAKCCPRSSVIFIDTLNRASPTCDENSSKDMGAIIAGSKLLQTLTDGLVVVLAHTGKDASKGLRGHSSLPAALDAMILVTRNSRGAEWEVTKAKDGMDGVSCNFKLAVQSCNELDQYGEPITSCVVEFDTPSMRTAAEKTPGGANQALAVKALQPLFERAEYDKPGAPSGRQCIRHETAIEAVVSALPQKVPSARRYSRAKEAIKGLVDREILGQEGDWFWLE